MTALDLAPPYLTLRPAAAAPPLGGVRLLPGGTDPGAALLSVPWVAPCLLVRPEDPGSVPIPGHLARRFATLHLLTPGGAPVPELVLQAVRARPAPSPAEVADYVVERLDVPGERELVAAQLLGGDAIFARAESAAELIRLRGSVSGRLRPHEWRWLYHLVMIAASGSSAVEQVEGRSAVSIWSALLLRARNDLLRELVGWEWVVERALRVAGLVREPAKQMAGPARVLDCPLGPLAPTWLWDIRELGALGRACA